MQLPPMDFRLTGFQEVELKTLLKKKKKKDFEKVMGEYRTLTWS